MDSLPHTARFARSRRFSTCTRLFKKYFLLPWPRRPWSCLSSRLAILTETLNSSLVQALFLSQRHFCFPLRISPPPLPNRPPPPPPKNKNMSGQVSSPPDCVPARLVPRECVSQQLKNAHWPSKLLLPTESWLLLGEPGTGNLGGANKNSLLMNVLLLLGGS